MILYLFILHFLDFLKILNILFIFKTSLKYFRYYIVKKKYTKNWNKIFFLFTNFSHKRSINISHENFRLKLHSHEKATHQIGPNTRKLIMINQIFRGPSENWRGLTAEGSITFRRVAQVVVCYAGEQFPVA